MKLEELKKERVVVMAVERLWWAAWTAGTASLMTIDHTTHNTIPSDPKLLVIIKGESQKHWCLMWGGFKRL